VRAACVCGRCARVCVVAVPSTPRNRDCIRLLWGLRNAAWQLRARVAAVAALLWVGPLVDVLCR
jgi:hypothetical protein